MASHRLAACFATAAAAILVSAYLHSASSFYWIYSDVYSFWGRGWVAAGQVPYSKGAFLEYPPISGLVLYGARILGGLFSSYAGSLYAGYYDWFSILSLGAALGIAWSTWRLARALGKKVNPLYFFLPSMLVYGVYNFDLFNALFVVLCLQCFVEKKRGWSAMFMGLAIATKLVAVVMIPVFLMDIGNWRERGTYLGISAAAVAALFSPLALFNLGYFGQFLSYFSGWGLEDAWYLWIFGSPFSGVAKIFGYTLFALLVLRVYTLRIPVAQKSFLALSGYLFATTVYAPQFNLMLVPLIAALAISSPWLLSMEVFNALIIFTWFTIPATPTSGPTWPWTLPQAMALLRTVSLGMLGLSVASANGHSVFRWMKAKLGVDKTLDPYLGSQGPPVIRELEVPDDAPRAADRKA